MGGENDFGSKWFPLKETIHLFTYARFRQMLNNSSREADNTQLYLGYGGVGVRALSSFVQPKNLKGITLQDRTGQRGK